MWYLPQINQSPASTSLMVETMRRSLKIASEGQKENISVTYDLAIANLAMQIQAEEKLLFKTFISLGSFHLEMVIWEEVMGTILQGKKIWNV